MLGFKDCRCARILLSGIELMPMISKGQMKSGALGTPDGPGNYASHEWTSYGRIIICSARCRGGASSRNKCWWEACVGAGLQSAFPARERFPPH
jgi:hypothetical protein